MIISGCFLTNSRPFMPFPYHFRTFPGHFSNIFTVYPRHLYPIPDLLVDQLVTIRCQFPAISDRFLAIRDPFLPFLTIQDGLGAIFPIFWPFPFRPFQAVSLQFQTISGRFPTITWPFQDISWPFKTVSRLLPDYFRPFPDHLRPFPDHFKPFPDHFRLFQIIFWGFKTVSRPFQAVSCSFHDRFLTI